ncbi:hypothetical protein ABQF34_29510 [Mycolicibacterium boenickei]
MIVNSGSARRKNRTKPSADRKSRERQPWLARAVTVGGAAFCLALVAEAGAPDAEALSVLIPAGNGNATQIDILEGNVIDPQFGLDGNGNTSHNSAVGNVLSGLGNNSPWGTKGGGVFGVIVLGGAQGSGNVTQISILSYNIFNPQFSLDGSNISVNTTTTNVASNNGNSSVNEATSGGLLGIGAIGAVLGNGNTTQYALFSGNILNPQFSLFGDNTSTNTAVTNSSTLNGNWSQNLVSGSGLGTGLLGAITGNGNTTQYALFVSNIFNPQFSFLGKNDSLNEAITNWAEGNGNDSINEVESGGLGNNGVVGGTSGNGNSDQTADGSGNIFNEQLRLGNEIMLPGMKKPIEIPGTDLLKSGVQQTNAAVNNALSAGQPLGKAAAHVKNAVEGAKTAVDKTKNAVGKSLKKLKAEADTPNQADVSPSNDGPDSDD